MVSGGLAPYAYHWNGIATAGPDTIGLVTGNYTLVVTDNNGCVDSTGVYSVGNVSTLSVDTSGLVTTNENCTDVDGSITGITVSGGVSPYTFNWNGVLTSSADTIGLGAGSYTLTISDNAGCVVAVGPFSLGTSSTLSTSDSAVIISDEHCGSVDGSITGISATGSGLLSYQWNGVASSSMDTTGLSSGTYSLVITDDNGCIDSLGPYVVNNIPGPSIDTSGILIADDACGQGIGAVSSIAVSGGTGSYNIQWNGNSSGLDTTGLFAGDYTLIVVDSVGCFDSIGPITIGDVGSPTASFTANPVVTDVNNPLIDFFDASSSDVVQWNWQFDTLGTDGVQNPSFNFTDPGTYLVTLVVTNGLNCSDSTSLTIVVNALDTIVIPNIITTDGNGKNDVFRIDGMPAGSYMSIYNRWGQKLFETYDYLNNWDGRTSTGERVKNGTYYYIIIDPDGNEYSGHISVIGG